MRIAYAAGLAVLLYGLAAAAAPPASVAADPTPTQPGKGGIRLPDVVAPVQPVFPGAVPKLLADQWYVIDSDTPVIVLASPEGLVSINEEVGPVKMHGLFVGETKKTTKTFKGKQVFTVEAVAAGRVELVIIPTGVAKAADIVRQSLDVDAGAGPQPPPVVPVVPIVDAFTKAVQDAYALEAAPDKAANAAKLAKLYRTASAATVMDPTVTTYGTLFADMKAASLTLLPEAAIPGVRKVIGNRLNLFTSKPTDSIDRAKTVNEFLAVATALEGVK